MNEEIKPGEMVLTEGGDYAPVSDGEPFKAHISSLKEVEGKNFDTGEPEPRLAIDFTLDEGEGQGQVYSAWYKPSLFPKSNLGKLLVALFGEIPRELDVTTLKGLPLRITLKTKGENGRQFPDTYLKPAADQKKVEVAEVKKDVVPTETLTEEEFNKILDEATEASK